jgi:hypothetical protein
MPARRIDFLCVTIWATHRSRFNDDTITNFEPLNRRPDLDHFAYGLMTKINTLDPRLSRRCNTRVCIDVEQREVRRADATLVIAHAQPLRAGEIQ